LGDEPVTGLTPKVFVDFDGTITKLDVGNSFFRTFGDEAESLKAVEQWKSGELSGGGLLLREAGYVDVDEKEAREFSRSCEIDESFKSFYSFCTDKGIPVTILSDGLDFYISEILSTNSLQSIPFFSNRAIFDARKISIELPYESDCTKCANCKGHQILARTGPEDVVVYIGNGYSDRCAVKYADMVFAKDDLLKYCEESNITYFPFKSFGDVLAKFRKTVEAGNFRKRHRAELNRREAYLAE
jgi:2-hydroxy-3-keto-5-methylthiopentenyl-1-phosphate phosphatase